MENPGKSNEHIFETVKILDWTFTIVNLFAIFILIWWLIPAVTQLASDNRAFHEARADEGRRWREEVTKIMAKNNQSIVDTVGKHVNESELEATAQRSKAYGKLEEIIRSLTVDRKREHDEFRKNLEEMKQLFMDKTGKKPN